MKWFMFSEGLWDVIKSGSAKARDGVRVDVGCMERLEELCGLTVNEPESDQWVSDQYGGGYDGTVIDLDTPIGVATTFNRKDEPVLVLWWDTGPMRHVTAFDSKEAATRLALALLWETDAPPWRIP